MNKHQSGFTLVELMISIVLGLLVVAASLMVFFTGQRSLGVQEGLSDVQQGSMFGLGSLAYDLRHTNLNMPSDQVINKKVVGSGVIFTAENLPAPLGAWAEAEQYLTSPSLHDDATEKNDDDDATEKNDDDEQSGKSDQLVIQFLPEYIVTESIDESDSSVPVVQVNTAARNFDCEGNAINFTSNKESAAGTITIAPKPTIVYRYYLDALPDTKQKTGENTRYGLYCDAGYYFSGDSAIQGLGDGEQLIIGNVDAFKVQFGLKNPAGKYRYAGIKTYIDDEADNVNVVSIEVGILMTSGHSIGADASLNSRTTFNVAGNQVTLKDNAANGKYLRQVVNQVVGFRNTLGGS